MTAVGRRPGNPDTRTEIVAAARALFAEVGYDRTSIRAIARRAGVDAALVHHYFDGKAALFVAAMALPFDPRQVKEHAAGLEYSGSRTIEGFLTMWDLAEGTGSSFASCLSAMAASSNVADAMREFVNERVWSVLRHNDGETEALRRRRTAMVSSQLMGLAFARYILRVAPMSTASPKQIGRWVGPTLDRYVKEPIES